MTSEGINSKRSTLHDVNGTFSIIVELLTIVVNVLPVYVILKWKHFRNRSTSDDVIIVLSAFFILSMLVPSPIAHVSYFNKGWYGGKVTCTFYQVTVNWLRLSTLCLITTLCIDKAFSVYLFIHQKPTSSPKGKITLITGILVLTITSLIVSVLPLIGLGPSTNDESTCFTWINAKPKSRVEYVFVISFLSCGFCNLICIFLSKVYMGFYRKSVILKLYERTGNNRNNDVRWQMEGTITLHGIRMAIAISLLVYITWLPALVLILLKTLGMSVSDISVLYALMSTTLSGLLNPIIYGLSDLTFRRGYKRIFQGIKSFCRCRTNRFQTIQVVTSDSGEQRSDVDHLPTTETQNGDSGPEILQTSGVFNSAFSENRDDTMNLPRYIENDRNAEEGTRLIPRNEFEASSHFGGPNNIILTSSSSSMLSSDEDSYEELESDCEEPEVDEGHDMRLRESIM